MKIILCFAVVLAVFAFSGTAFATDGATVYGAKCQMCHGAGGAGGMMGPALAGMDFIKGDASHIKDAINNGIPASAKKHPNFPMAMPKVALSEAEQDAVVEYLKGL